MTEPSRDFTSPADPADPADPVDRVDSAEPFEPGPASLSGCGKPAVIGCLVVLVLGAVGLVLLLTQSPKLMRYLMRQMEEQITTALPPDLDEEKRRRLDEGFDGAVTAILEGRIDASSMSKLQGLSKSMPGPGQTLSHEQVDEIIRLLEEIGSVPAPAARGGPEAPPDSVPHLRPALRRA